MRAIIKDACIRGHEVKTGKNGNQYVLVRYEEGETGMRIELDDIWVEVEGDMDSAGMMGYTGIRPGYQHIRFVFHVKTDAPPARVQALIDLVEQRCPVGDSLKNGVPLDKPRVVLEY